MNKPSFRLLDTGLVTAAENMALDEVLLEEISAGRSRPTLRFLRFSPPAALVGRHQSVSREIRREYCLSQGVDINRRITGGGAIFFQTSALGWELIGPLGIPPFTGSYESILKRICNAAAAGLSRTGLPVSFRPRNDLEVNGKKIGGTGGAFTPDGCLVQGTLLMENEMELFLRCLRVPVEKLKKREIESLAERVGFLNDLLPTHLGIEDLKNLLAESLADLLGFDLSRQGLTGQEQRQLASLLPYFQSDKWIEGPRPHSGSARFYQSFYQTDAGTLRLHIWLEPRSRRIRQVLVTGDFFCRPSRHVLDLEAWLKGVKANPTAVEHAIDAFHHHHTGSFLGISAEEIKQAFHTALERLDLTTLGLDSSEINEIFLVNMAPVDLASGRPQWLLLPYCSKKTDCGYRSVPDCGRCGECEFDPLYGYGEKHGLNVISIQSFEHLMAVLGDIRQRTAARSDSAYYVGSCCEAFYTKHQREMEAAGPQGVLVNLDSTTCYDLGKGMDAYRGVFDHKTDLNCLLIEKMVNIGCETARNHVSHDA